MIRQLLGVISEFEKASLVAKLRGARERKKRATGKCEGRKSIAELRPDTVALARELRRRRPKPTLRAISAELAVRGHLAGSASRSSRQSWRGCCAVNCERPAKCLGAESRSGVEWAGSAFSPGTWIAYLSRIELAKAIANIPRESASRSSPITNAGL